MSGDYEETFCMLEPCFVYKIPPRSTTQGYKASDWDLEHPVWTGRLKVTALGERAFVKLEDRSTGQVFAVCNVNVDKSDEAVEAVLDSSRYYVLRIEDEHTKRHAFIGMGFHERDQSFEFKAALQDHSRRVFTERRLASEPRRELPALNLAMKDGETIVVDIRSVAAPSKPTGSRKYDDDDSDDVFLPPPPSGNKKISALSAKGKRAPAATAAPAKQPVQAAQPAPVAAPTAPKTNDPFGLLSLDSTPVAAPVQAAPAIQPATLNPAPGFGQQFQQPVPFTQPSGAPLQPMGMPVLSPYQPQPVGAPFPGFSQGSPIVQQSRPGSYTPIDPNRKGVIISGSTNSPGAPPPKQEAADPFSGLVNFAKF